MANKDHKPGSPLRPLEGDKDLYYIADLRRDDSEIRKFQESVIQDANRLKSSDKESGKR